MRKEIITQEQLQQMISLSDKFNAVWFRTAKKFSKWVLKLIPVILGYSFMSWIFLSLYDSYGFDRTIIILLVGVLWYGLRKRGE